MKNCRPPIYQGANEARTLMQGFGYLVAAYAIVWIGLFIFLAVLMLRIRGVRTELAVVEQMVREQQEKHNID
jgi:CcmD family protein